MPIRPETDEMIEFLNQLLTFDRHAIGELLVARVPCNEVMSRHPTVQVSGASEDHFRVGMLGVLNGFCGTIDDGPRRGWGPITAIYDDGVLQRFARTDP